jgi:hypothetical protein
VRPASPPSGNLSIACEDRRLLLAGYITGILGRQIGKTDREGLQAYLSQYLFCRVDLPFHTPGAHLASPLVTLPQSAKTGVSFWQDAV